MIKTKKHKPKPGYKQTALGWIPEDWEMRKVKDVYEFVESVSYTRENLTYEKTNAEILYIHYGDIHAVFDSETLDINTENIIPYLKDEYCNRKFSFLKDGDLVIADASEDYEGIGKSIEVCNIREKNVISGLHTIVLRAKPGKTIVGFNTYIMSNYAVRVAIMRIATGISVFGITKNNLAKVSLVVPSLKEQKAIAAVLSTWDKAISNYQLLIINCQLRKKYLMQQLLTGKKRLKGFKGEWEEVRLGDCSVIKGGYGINAPAVEYSDNLPSYLRITDIDDDGNYSTEKKVSVDNINAGEYILNNGDIVFARTGATVGKTYLHDAKNGELIFAGFLIRFRLDSKILLPAYLKNYATTKPYWDWVKVQSMRSGQPGINASEYCSLKFIIPPIMEQVAILKILQNADEEITLCKHKLEALKEQKKGLMQVLLTGKKRIKL